MQHSCLAALLFKHPYCYSYYSLGNDMIPIPANYFHSAQSPIGHELARAAPWIPTTFIVLVRNELLYTVGGIYLRHIGISFLIILTTTVYILYII